MMTTTAYDLARVNCIRAREQCVLSLTTQHEECLGAGHVNFLSRRMRRLSRIGSEATGGSSVREGLC